MTRDRDGESYGAMVKRIDRARTLCTNCPLATDCLRWALVNPTEITRVGIWAATAPYERQRLRARLAQRLGPNWVDVLAARLQDDKDRADRARQARHHPLTVEQTRLLHLDRTHNGRRGRRHSAPGRAVYAVVCTTCGTVGEPHHLRVLADPAAANHREEHRLHANTPAQPEKEAAPQKQARARTNLDATK
ncbi:WhiB family transcriptional regulator [Streptomyces albidoflavus]